MPLAQGQWLHAARNSSSSAMHDLGPVKSARGTGEFAGRLRSSTSVSITRSPRRCASAVSGTPTARNLSQPLALLKACSSEYAQCQHQPAKTALLLLG